MRADRLLAILMLLQTRGRRTAQDLARELEVTERTIYRDIGALSASGVPVYAERGPGGGISLVEGYRTNLTGLSPGEVRALFTLSIPAPLDQLGLGAELRTAMLKLSAALPESRRSDETGARDRIHLDPDAWFQTGEKAPLLAELQTALWKNQMLEIIYLAEFGTQVEMLIEPYGLVAKANAWHLVGARTGKLHAWRVSRIRSARLRPETFDRPPDFNLHAFWINWCQEIEANRPEYRVRARISPTLARILNENWPENLQSAPTTNNLEGWQEQELKFESLEAARTRILGFGGAIEVLEPLALRLSLADYANQVLSRYIHNHQE